jgi:hypothetical protein
VWEIRMLRAMRWALETGLRKPLTGTKTETSDSQGVSFAECSRERTSLAEERKVSAKFCASGIKGQWKT